MSLTFSVDGPAVLVSMIGEGPPSRDPWTRNVSTETVVLRRKLTLEEARRVRDRLDAVIAEAGELWGERAEKEAEFERLKRELGK